MSNNNQYAGLKRESAENNQRCFELLASARAIHEDTVIFDATLDDDGEIKFSIFTSDDEILLQERAQILLDQPGIRELVVGARGGTVVSVVTDEENIPAWARTHGTQMPNGFSVESGAEEADD